MNSNDKKLQDVIVTNSNREELLWNLEKLNH